MSPPAIWSIILAGMLLTYLTRLSFIALIPPDKLPRLLRRGLQFVFPSVLAALILPELVGAAGDVDLTWGNHRLWAACAAAAAALKWGNTWITIGVGMGVLWLLQSIV